MQRRGIILGLVVAVVAGSGCDDDGVLSPPLLRPTGGYSVATTVVSNSCTETTGCTPICRLWWFGITHEQQSLHIDRYRDDLVVCPLGPANESRIVGGTYHAHDFSYDSVSRVIVSNPAPGCRLEQRWTSTISFRDSSFTGEALYELVVTEGDPAICAAASEHFATLPCETRYRFDAIACAGCTPECEPG